MDEKERKYWDNFIRNLCDLNYIKPFRHLIHYMLHNIRVLQDEVAAFGDYVTEDVFEELVKRVTAAEEEIEKLGETKAEKADVEKLEGRMDDAEEAIDALSEELGDVTGNVGSLGERMTAAEESIENLRDSKAEKSDLDAYEKETDARLDTLDECCSDVQDHLKETDKRLDTDEANIDTLLDNMLVLSDHVGVIATDNYFDDYLDTDMDGLVREMSENGVMKYEIYTAYYPEHAANWVSQIHDAVKEIYDWEWENNFAFIQVDTILFGGTSPRVMVTLIPRERDVYICLCYHVGDITEAFDGHCFIHRTPTEALEERIAACEERLDVVEDMLGTLAEADRLIAERVSVLEERADKTDETLAQHDKRIDAVQSEADTNAEDISNLKGCCQAVNATLADYNDRITAAQNTADTAEGKADHNAEDISHLEDDISDIRSRIGNSIVRITPGYSASDTGVTETVTFTDNNGAEVKTYAGSVTGISCDIKETDNGDTIYTITAYYLADELGTTDTYTYTITVPTGYDDTALREEIDKLEREYADLAAQVDQIASETDGIGDRVDNVEKSVESLTEDVSDLDQRMTDAEKSIDDLEQLTGETKEAVNDLTDTVRENTADIETIFDTPLELTGTLTVDPVEITEGEKYTATLTDTSIINLKGDEIDAEEYILDHDVSQIDAYFALNSVRRFKISQTADGTESVTDTIEDPGIYALDGQSAVLQYTDGSHRVIHNGVAGVNVTAESPEPFAFYSADDDSINFYYRGLPTGDTFDGKTITNLYTNFTNVAFTTGADRPWHSTRYTFKVIYIDSSFINAKVDSFAYWFYDLGNCTRISGICYLPVTSTTDLSYLFYNLDNIQSDDWTGFGDWDVSGVTNMRYMFYGCSSLRDLSGLSDWDVSSVTDMRYMFYGCSSLRDLSGLSDWDVSSVTDMRYMFCGCNGLSDLSELSDWDISSVTVIEHAFYRCSGLSDLSGLSDWDVSSVTNIGGMFYGCSGLSDLSGLSDWDVSSVTNMRYLFYNCSGLSDLSGLSDWDVSSVTNIEYAFYNCSGLSDLSGLSDWDVSSVTNMDYAFNGCTGLSDLSGLSDWDVSSVTTMRYIFSSCSNVKVFDLSKWTINVNGHGTFNSCTQATTIYASDATVFTGNNIMFDNCPSLVGGAGTVYDADHTDASYAHIDGGEGDPGYFTAKE